MRTTKYPKGMITMNKTKLQRQLRDGLFECQQDIKLWAGHDGFTIIRYARGFQTSIIIKNYFKS